MTTPPEWVTTAEAAAMLRQTARTVRERAQAGELGPRAILRDGRRYLIRRAAIERHLERAAQ